MFSPVYQIGFIDFVAGPVYEMLGKQFGELKVLDDQVKSNRALWVELQKQGPYQFVTPASVLAAKSITDVLSSVPAAVKDFVVE